MHACKSEVIFPKPKAKLKENFWANIFLLQLPHNVHQDHKIFLWIPCQLFCLMWP